MAIEQLLGPWWLHFRVSLADKYRISAFPDFSFSCVEDNTSFDDGIGQLLNICKTFRLLADG
uniref:Uncharacterized protein n=1 Tax=Romanomermis culicivorax TaxID=13658 RepID=A0A915JLU8_ROMCU